MKLEHIHKISDTFSVRLIYVDICDDLVSGILLSQLVYWSVPDKEGKSKLRIKHDGHFWIAKRRTDWEEEIRISPKQYDRAIVHLQKLGFVTTKVFKFGASTMVHVRLLASNIEKAVYCQLNRELPKGEFENSPKGKTGITERDIPSYTENTNRDYAIDGERIPEGLEDQDQNLPPAAEQVAAYAQSKMNFAYSSKFLSLLVAEAEHWSLDVVKHLIDRIAEDPSKPANYYKRMIDNWAKIKPTPTTAAEVMAGDKKKGAKAKQAPKPKDQTFDIDSYLKGAGQLE